MKEITITLFKSEIIYDAINKAHLVARNRQPEGGEAAANMQINEEEPDFNELRRSLGNAFALIRPKLSPYLTEIVVQPDRVCGQDTQIGSDDLLIDCSNNLVTLSLTMPQNFSHAFVEAITTSLHNCIVYGAISDWFLLSNPAEAATYRVLAESSLEDAKRFLDARIKPVRRGKSVF